MLHRGNYYFNSTMVRLKEARIVSRAQSNVFQFHYGTIKSMSRLMSSSTFTYFNSTMVRLKEWRFYHRA